MAASSELRTVLALEWKPLRPLRNQVRKSPVFSIMDVKWNLQMSACDCNGFRSLRVVLRLIKAENEERCSKPFLVSVFVQGADYRDKRCFKSVSSASEILLEDSRNFESLRVFQVLCLFHDVTLSLELSKDTSLLPTNDESLVQDFGNMLEAKAFSDANLRCGKKTFPIHRNVLAARSEVFAAMFRNKMAESETGIVEIQDMDARVLSVFLTYVYSGKISGISDDLLPGLYAAGDKYAVHALKKTCAVRLINNLAVKNCMDILFLSHAHSDDGLKNQVIAFICRNEGILLSEEWLKFCKGTAVSIRRGISEFRPAQDSEIIIDEDFIQNQWGKES